jgi:hypothetical protein
MQRGSSGVHIRGSRDAGVAGVIAAHGEGLAGLQHVTLMTQF